MIDLPVPPLEEPKSEKPSDWEEHVERPRRKVLVVDDEMHIRHILQEYLEEKQFDVVAEGDGHAALKQLREQPFDVVITDIKMPKMDGRELFQQIQNDYPNLAPRTIFLTGDTMSEETEGFTRSTENPSLSKPIRLQKVLQTIDEILSDEVETQNS